MSSAPPPFWAEVFVSLFCALPFVLSNAAIHKFCAAQIAEHKTTFLSKHVVLYGRPQIRHIFQIFNYSADIYTLCADDITHLIF